MATQDKYGRWILSTLSGEASFARNHFIFHQELEKALLYQKAVQEGAFPLPMTPDADFMEIFQQMFEQVHGQKYTKDTPRRLWWPAYQRGAKELADMGIAQLERNEEGDYLIVSLDDDKVTYGAVQFH